MRIRDDDVGVLRGTGRMHVAEKSGAGRGGTGVKVKGWSMRVAFSFELTMGPPADRC